MAFYLKKGKLGILLELSKIIGKEFSFSSYSIQKWFTIYIFSFIAIKEKIK